MQILKFTEFIRSRNSLTESKRKISQEKLISNYHDRLFRGVRSIKREAQTEEINKAAKALLPVISKYGFNEKTAFLLVEFLIDKIIRDNIIADYLERNNILWKIAQLFLNSKLQKLIDTQLKKVFSEVLHDLMHKEKQDLYTAAAIYLKEEPYDAIDNITFEFFKDIRVKFCTCFDKLPTLILVDYICYKEGALENIEMKFANLDGHLEDIIIEKIEKIIESLKRFHGLRIGVSKFSRNAIKDIEYDKEITRLSKKYKTLPEYTSLRKSKVTDSELANLRNKKRTLCIFWQQEGIFSGSAPPISSEDGAKIIIDALEKKGVIEVAKIAQTTNVIRRVGII